MTERERLIELLKNNQGDNTYYMTDDAVNKISDVLLANGVVVLPCIAMVEQFIKDGKFDRKHTAHNGRMAVVYIDKSKYACPLIDITEGFYNTGKAYERIEALKDAVHAEKALEDMKI